MGEKQLYKFQYPKEELSLTEACKILKIPIDKCSLEFGVVNIDPENNIHVILIDTDNLNLNDNLFGNTRIEPFDLGQ